MKYAAIAALIYLVIISVISAVVTVADKAAAKSKARRVPERTLLLLGAAGGALAMYIVMLTIRHKTKHAKFMITLPVFIVIHAVLLILLFTHI